MWSWSRLPTMGTHWLSNCPWMLSKQCAKCSSCAETGPLMETQKQSLEKHFKCFLLDSILTVWFECKMPPRDMCVKTRSPVAGTVLGTVVETLNWGWSFMALVQAGICIKSCLRLPGQYGCHWRSFAWYGHQEAALPCLLPCKVWYPLWSHEPEINFPLLNIALSGILSQQQEKSPMQQGRVN